MQGQPNLEVHLRVPVLIKDDDGVGCLQIEAEAAGTCGEEEEEERRPRAVELVQRARALRCLGRAVEAQVREACAREEQLQQVQQLRELAEQQHPAPDAGGG